MFGSSRESLAVLRASLGARAGEPGFDAVAGDLLAVAGLLGREKSLRLALADAGQPAEARAAIATSLLGDRISAPALAIVTEAVSRRWSSDADLVDAFEVLGAQAAFAVAQADGSLDRVEDELFTFSRAIDDSSDLQMALTDPSLPAERKAAIVRELASSAAPATVAVLAHAAGNLRGRRPASAVEDLARIASEQRQQVLAEVRSAIELTPEQNVRLASALSALQGRQVRLNVLVDPAVVGGIVVRVGDDVIDGSVSSRLEQARRALSA